MLLANLLMIRKQVILSVKQLTGYLIFLILCIVQFQLMHYFAICLGGRIIYIHRTEASLRKAMPMLPRRSLDYFCCVSFYLWYSFLFMLENKLKH